MPLWVNNEDYALKCDKPELNRKNNVDTNFYKTRPKIKLENIYLGNECGITFNEFGKYKRKLEELIRFNFGYPIELDWNFKMKN